MHLIPAGFVDLDSYVCRAMLYSRPSNEGLQGFKGQKKRVRTLSKETRNLGTFYFYFFELMLCSDRKSVNCVPEFGLSFSSELLASFTWNNPWTMLKSVWRLLRFLGTLQ